MNQKNVAVAVAIVAAFGLGALLFSGDDSPKRKTDTHEHEDGGEWTCSMHPQVRAGEPGACPICGMDLIPVENDSSSSDMPPNRLSLSEDAKIRARIRTTKVGVLGGSGRIERRLLGRVDYDETRQRLVTSWISGRIDKLRIRSTGQRVKRGQVIATLYSPEVFSAHQDLLVARKQAAGLASASPIARLGAEAALVASRDRLRLLGVPVSEIATMEKATRPSEQVRIRSPFAGTIIKRIATEGSYVKTGAPLFEIADLSVVWIQLDAYESDLPMLGPGHSVSLQVKALPGATFEGKVTFVDPVLDARTRTTRVRIEVANRKGQLRPGMFAEAVVRSEAGSEAQATLVIPATAPLFTGRRSVVYVEIPGMESPTYEARLVKLGPRMGEVYPVIAGLDDGDRVVVHGAFTLDADLQIRGGNSMMSSPDDTEDYDVAPVTVPEAHRAALATVLTHYLALHKALSSDDLAATRTALAALGEAARALGPSSAPVDFRDAWLPIQAQLVTHTAHASHASSLADARTPFRDLSLAITRLLTVLGNPTEIMVHEASCPMAFDGVGARWVQEASAVQNPYFGAEMYTCGEIEGMVKSGGYRPSAGKGPRRAAPAGGHQH